MTPVLWVDVSKFKSRRGKLTSYFSPAIELCQSQLSTSLFIRLISQECSYLDKYIGEFFNNCGNETASLLYQHFKAIRTLIVFKLGSSSRQTTVDKFSIFRLQAFKILLVQRIFLILLVERSARAILFSHWQSLPLTKLLFKVLGVLSALYVFGNSRLLGTIRLNSFKILTWGAYRNSGNIWNDNSRWLVVFARNFGKCCAVCNRKNSQIRTRGILVECKVPILVYQYIYCWLQ